VLCEPLLKLLIHHGNRKTEIANLELCGNERNLSVSRSQVSCQRDVNLLAFDFSRKLAPGHIALEADLIVRNFLLPIGWRGIGAVGVFDRWGRDSCLGYGSTDFVGGQTDFSLAFAQGSCLLQFFYLALIRLLVGCNTGCIKRPRQWCRLFQWQKQG
jgi:hypothetical protein